MLKIDELDQKILKILEEDGRISYRQLGKKLGIEESTARKRVIKLREKGVIERFTVEINEATLGRTITAFITVYPSLKHADRVIKEVLNFDEVLESYNLSGRCSIFLKAMFGDIKALNKFITKMIAHANLVTTGCTYLDSNRGPMLKTTFFYLPKIQEDSKKRRRDPL